MSKNILLTDFSGEYGTPPFDEIQLADYEPAFNEAIVMAQSDIDAIVTDVAIPSFANVIEAMDSAGQRLNLISAIFFNLNHACTSTEMQEIAQRVSTKLTQYSTGISMNVDLFAKVKELYLRKEDLGLDVEQQTLLEDTWRMFVKGGANLEGKDRERFQEISIELSQLGLKFSENLLLETNDFILNVNDVAELSGLPDGELEIAKQLAKDRGLNGYVFTLHAPSYIPFMKYADNVELRKTMYKAYASRCNKGNEQDNKDIIKKIVALRLEKAQLLSCDSYAEYVLSSRMAENVETVNKFLADLLAVSHPKAIQEREELSVFSKELGKKDALQRWDWAYYANKLKLAKYDLDDELLRPYFNLHQVEHAVFDLATSLYGINFKQIQDVAIYHKDVKVYEVRDERDEFLAILYTDFFPRESKSGGAWMTDFRDQCMRDGVNVRPWVSIVMNFTKPTETKPSLLTFDELTTFLHEFGHSLHSILSQTKYSSTSGTNVMRDFVELPSQFMENWAYEKEWLDTWARHYQTGELIPSEYVDRIVKSANFHSAYQCDRQLSFGIVDMAWHSLNSVQDIDVVDFENQVMSAIDLFDTVEGCCFSTGFAHIFGGGYAAGYYSYKWAEVLDADAFSVFKTNGIFNNEIAKSFRMNILERGGSEHPMILYKRFRGQEPSVDALLERSGLIEK